MVGEIVSSLSTVTQRRADSCGRQGAGLRTQLGSSWGASLGKGEADNQEMDGVLGKRAGCGWWREQTALPRWMDEIFKVRWSDIAPKRT